MRFILGGYAQGKCAYVKEKYAALGQTKDGAGKRYQCAVGTVFKGKPGLHLNL